MDYHVLEARHVGGHVVWLRFRDGTVGEIDLGPALRGPMFEALRDVGDSESFEIIRTARSKIHDPLLLRLSFQVAEEIYWRSIGGMIQATT